MKVEPDAPPEPALLKVTEFATEPALPVMLAFNDVVEMPYRFPALPPIRPASVPSFGALVKVLVPLNVLLSLRREEEAKVQVEVAYEYALPVASMPRPPTARLEMYRAEVEAVPVTERLVEVALVAISRVVVAAPKLTPPTNVVEAAVQILPLAKLRVAVRVPPSAAGEPPTVRVLFASVRAMVEF